MLFQSWIKPSGGAAPGVGDIATVTYSDLAVSTATPSGNPDVASIAAGSNAVNSATPSWITQGSTAQKITLDPGTYLASITMSFAGSPNDGSQTGTVLPSLVRGGNMSTANLVRPLLDTTASVLPDFPSVTVSFVVSIPNVTAKRDLKVSAAVNSLAGDGSLTTVLYITKLS